MQKYSGFDYFQNKHGSKFLIIKKFTTMQNNLLANLLFARFCPAGLQELCWSLADDFLEVMVEILGGAETEFDCEGVHRDIWSGQDDPLRFLDSEVCSPDTEVLSQDVLEVPTEVTRIYAGTLDDVVSVAVWIEIVFAGYIFFKSNLKYLFLFRGIIEV